MIAGCRDGHGGVGFYHNIADVKDPEEFEQKAIHTPRLETVPDQWTSQIFARILAHHKVIMVSDLVDPKLVKDMHMNLLLMQMKLLLWHLKSKEMMQKLLLFLMVQALLLISKF